MGLELKIVYKLKICKNKIKKQLIFNKKIKAGTRTTINKIKINNNNNNNNCRKLKNK